MIQMQNWGKKVSIFKTEFNKANLSLQRMILGKSNLYEILGAQMIENNHQELGNVRQDMLCPHLLNLLPLSIR